MVLTAATGDEPVRRRAGLGLAEVWAVLREQVERRPVEVRVVARVRTARLDLLLRIHAGLLLAPPEPAEGGWTELEFGLEAIGATRVLLPYGTDLEVLSPPEARAELARVAADITALYGAADASEAVTRPADAP